MSDKRERLTPEQRALVVQYLPMARSFVRPYKLRWRTEAEDLDQAAMLGLVEAAVLFDPVRGVKFSTYMRLRVCGAVQDAIRKLRPKGWRSRPGVAMPRTTTMDSNSENYGKVLCVSVIEPPDAGLIAESDAHAFEAILRKVPTRQARILRAKYRDGQSQAEIGEQVGVSQTRVSFLLADAIDLLREDRSLCSRYSSSQA